MVTQLAGAVRVLAWAPEQMLERVDDAIAVYKAAFLDVHEPDPARAALERTAHARDHLARAGVRSAVALGTDARIVGFTYATPGRPGQWWHDVVSQGLGPRQTPRWLAHCLEIVELHVLPGHQGAGLGRRLLRTILTGAPQRTAALSALDLPDTRARRLYRSEGFLEVATQFRFPGTTADYVIMVRDLPIEAG